MITSPELEDPQVKNMEKACQAIGFSKNQYMLIDHGESFLLFPYPEKRDLEPEYRLVFFSPG